MTKLTIRRLAVLMTALFLLERRRFFWVLHGVGGAVVVSPVGAVLCVRATLLGAYAQYYRTIHPARLDAGNLL